MKTLSIRQPWAWLIINAGKDIENRTWSTKFRGRFLVHAAQTMKIKDYNDACVFARQAGYYGPIPRPEDLERGGIVGSVELDGITYCSHISKWQMKDCIGFMLKNPKPLDFIPMKGQLRFFDTEEQEVSHAQLN
jgi:ASCH domain